MGQQAGTPFNIHNIPVLQFSDRSIRWLLQNIEFVRGLFEIVARPLSPQIDFNRMEQVVGNTITDDLQGWVSDLAFLAPYRSIATDGEVGICILIEHQSTVDEEMVLRVDTYRSQIWNAQRRRWISNKVPSSQRRLCPVIPIVLYTGEQRWNVPLTFDAIMDVPEELSEFVPKFKILLLDVKQTEPEKLTQTGHPFGWLMTVLQKEHASEEEIRSALINAISHINTLGEEQRQQWDMALSYLLLLILHRRPVGQHDGLKAVVDEQIPPSRRKEVIDMVYSMANQLLDEGERRGLERGREEGEMRGIIESLLAFLASQYQPNAVQALKPALESIEDLQRLKELRLAAYNAQSLEAFTETLYE